MKRFFIFVVGIALFLGNVSSVLGQSSDPKADAQKVVKAAEENLAKVKEVQDPIIEAAQKEIERLTKEKKDRLKFCTDYQNNRNNFPNPEPDCEGTAYDDKMKDLDNQISQQETKRNEAQQKITEAENALANKNMDLLVITTSKFSIRDRLRASDTSHEADLTIIDPDTGGETNILNKIIKLFTQILGTFGILMLVIGGILMITSEGDENRLQRGKNIFFYTVVGLLVAFMSFVAVQFIISILFAAA